MYVWRLPSKSMAMISPKSYGSSRAPHLPPFTYTSRVSLTQWISIGISYLGSLMNRSDEHTSELQSLMRIPYAVYCLKKKIHQMIYRHSRTSNTRKKKNQ